MKHLEAVIFDWAGTTVDHGSLAPVKALTTLFARHGIHLTDLDVRRDMGIFKKDHIRRILVLPAVTREWQKTKGQPADERAVDLLFAEFSPLQMELLEEFSHPIEGVVALTGQLRDLGLKLGSTTGYTRPMLDLMKARAASHGYRPDISLCPDDVGGGRPYPWMCLHIALEFRLTGVQAAVKVGDTVSDIQEGLNAGMWTIGVSATGNQVGLSADELAALSGAERKRRIAAAAASLRSAGAHYVVESVGALRPVLEEIDGRLAARGTPVSK